MKKSLVLLSLLSLTSSVMASDVSVFVGLGFGASSNSYKISGKVPGVVEIQEEGKIDATRFGIIKSGLIFNKEHRLALSYNRVFYKDADINTLLASYDYLINVNEESRFYIGLHAGRTDFEGKDEIKFLDDSGASYGIQGGYIYDITPNFEFEIGAIYTSYNMKNKEGKMKIEGVDFDYNFKMKDSFSAFAGINYKF